MNKLSRRFIGNWAKLLPNNRKRQQQRRRLMAECLEDRRLLAVDFNVFHNYLQPTDVNGDTKVSPVDALAVINKLNGATGAAEGEHDAGTPDMKWDVNGDGHVSPVDALAVINDLAEGEAGAVVTFSHQATNLQGTPVTSVSIGQTFVLQTLVQDMRSTPQGVFAGYLDLDYDESLVQVNMRESQTIQLSAIPNAQTAQRGNATVSFNLSFNGATTATIGLVKEINAGGFFVTDPATVANFNAGVIQDALLALPGIDVGDMEVVPFSGGTVSGVNFEVKFGGQFAGTDVSKLVPSAVQLTSAAASGSAVPTVTIFNTSDELLVPTLAELQADDPNITAADRANLVARSEQTRSFTFAFPKYSSGQSGIFGVASQGSTNKILDEIGAFTSNQTPGGGDAEVLVEVQVKALAGGSARFLGNPSDQAPDHDVLVFGLDNAVSISDIGFNSLDITITSEITATPDTGTVDENAGPVFINVLANDSITTGTGPTITAPIPTTSVNGGMVVQSGANGFNYTPAPNFSGQDTFSYTITNGSATASATVTVTVNPIDDRPMISGPSSLNTNEDTAFTLGGFTITDPDSNNITVTLSANGGLSQTSFSGTPAQVTGTLNSITYTPIANSNAADTLTISASDGGLTGTKNVSITINPVNDPPINAIGNPPSVPVANTGTHTFPSGTFQVTDVDAGNTLNVTVSVLNGTLSSGGNTGTSLSFSGSSPINIGNLIYDPTDGFVGTDTLTITSTDGTATDTDTVVLTVAPPQFPFAAGDTYTTTEGAGTITLNPSPLNNDLRDDGAMLTATPANGSTMQGGSFTINGSTFTYTPPADPNFFGTDTFTYTIEQDAAHTPSSTGDTDSTGTVTINVQAVNDGPVNTVSGPRTVNEDTSLSFTGANLISIQDIDAGAGNVTTTLTASNGTINVTGGAGVTNNGSKNVSVTGTVAQVNNILAGVTYTPDLNFNGSDQLTVNTNDNGNTGGGALTDVDTINITVTPINDQPTIMVPGQQTFFTDFDNRFTSTPNPFQIGDADAGNNNVQVDLTIGDGAVTLVDSTGVTVAQNPGGNNGVRITGSVANINAALARGVNYRSSVDGVKTLNAVVNDLGNTGSGNQLTASAMVAVEVLDFVPVDIIGHVFIDEDGDGQTDPDEPGIEGVHVLLSGTDFQGNAVRLPAVTDEHGEYSFLGLRPNAAGQPYTITQEQPAFIQGGGQATFSLDALGNVAFQTGSLAFGADGFIPEFTDVWDVFDSSDVAPQDSGILIGMDGGGQDWSIFYGGGWDMQRYGNARLELNADGNSGVLTVFDSQLRQDRTANLSANNGTLTYRGHGVDRVYRVIGGSELLGPVGAAAEGEQTTGGNATTSMAAYIAAVNSIFDSH
ncbi:MAG: tandem-95 repeat protein [Planctomycetia bacterium]|nr:tandem-95 repeat protein [Planctomycetia bacterium]